MTSPLQQKIKITGPVVVTANRVGDGAVIYRSAAGEWTTELDEAVVKSLGDRIGEQVGREVQLSTEIQPDILGGIVLRVGNVILDASTGFTAGQKFYLYTPQLDHLSNDAENFGGLMTEVNICTSVDPITKVCKI